MRAQRGRRRWWRAALGVAIRPMLWPVAARAAVRASPPGWWRRPPFVPLPDRAYLRWRLETQYGTDGAPSPDDVVGYLRWVREMDRVRSTAPGLPTARR